MVEPALVAAGYYVLLECVSRQVEKHISLFEYGKDAGKLLREGGS